jgi:hypothetical protein
MVNFNVSEEDPRLAMPREWVAMAGDGEKAETKLINSPRFLKQRLIVDSPFLRNWLIEFVLFCRERFSSSRTAGIPHASPSLRLRYVSSVAAHCHRLSWLWQTSDAVSHWHCPARWKARAALQGWFLS